MSFFDELKRRRVFRVASSYAVVAFIVMQLVEIIFPMFNFPPMDAAIYRHRSSNWFSHCDYSQLGLRQNTSRLYQNGCG